MHVSEITGGGPRDHAKGTLLSWLRCQGSLTHAAVVIVVCIAKYGIGVYPSWQIMQAIAVNWRNPDLSPLPLARHNYQLLSSGASLVAGILHVVGDRAFLGFNLSLALIALTAVFALPKVRRSPDLRVLITLLTIGGAVPAILLNWVGGYDAITIAAASTAVLADSQWLVLAAWAVYSFNNTSEAAISLALIVAYLLVAKHRTTRRTVFYGTAGVVIGYGLIQLMTMSWGVQNRWSYFISNPFSTYVYDEWKYLPLILLWSFGTGWILILSRSVRAMPGIKPLVWISLAVILLVPLIAMDEVRVVATVLWPLILLVAADATETLSVGTIASLTRRTAPAAILAIAVMPWTNVLVWGGWHSLARFVLFMLGKGQPPISL